MDIMQIVTIFEAQHGNTEHSHARRTCKPRTEDLFPERQVVGSGRQRLEASLFERLKLEAWLGFGGAMNALASGGAAPVQHIGVGLGDGGWCAATEEVALEVVHAALFNFAFVLRSGRAAGGDQEAVVLGAFSVGLLDLGVIPAGLSDGRFEVVDHQALGHAAEELKRVTMEQAPGGDGLVEDELDILVAADVRNGGRST